MGYLHLTTYSDMHNIVALYLLYIIKNQWLYIFFVIILETLKKKIYLFFLFRFVKKFNPLLLTSKVLFLIGLMLLIFQDFKDRKVTFLVFPFLGILGVILHYNTQYLELFFFNLIVNLALLLLVLLMLMLYVKLIMKKQLNEVIGLGDLLFFVILGVSFPTVSFVIIFCSSLVFSLIIYILLKQKIGKYIPLAGLQALFLFLALLSNLLFNFVNLYAV